MASSTPSSSQVPASQASSIIVAAANTTEENVVYISDGEGEAAAAPGTGPGQAEMRRPGGSRCGGGRPASGARSCGRRMARSDGPLLFWATWRNEEPGNRMRDALSCFRDRSISCTW